MSHTPFFFCTERQTVPLRHVDGFPVLWLLWELCYHSGYSEPRFSWRS